MNPQPKEVCPRCGKDMTIEKDEGDEFFNCSQCGFREELHKIRS